MPDLPPTLPSELHPFEVLAGRWDDGPTRESWVAAGDVWWGLSFGPDDWVEVMYLDVLDGRVRFVAKTPEGPPVAFPLARTGRTEWTFSNPEHDAPRNIRYRVRGARLVGSIGNERVRAVLRARAAPLGVAPELEEADRAFYRDVAARGADAWVEAFDPAGTQWDDAAKRAVTPTDGMRELMAGTLAGALVWDPVASGLAPSGAMGFTVGTWTWTPPGGAAPAASGSYVTVWRRAADGAWKVWFDTGDSL